MDLDRRKFGVSRSCRLTTVQIWNIGGWYTFCFNDSFYYQDRIGLFARRKIRYNELATLMLRDNPSLVDVIMFRRGMWGTATRAAFHCITCNKLQAGPIARFHHFEILDVEPRL